jgi:ribonuclease D
METAGLGLNIFQVLQNELITREGNRSTLGLGFRLAIIEDRLKNHEARSKNGLIWRPYHAIAPISAPTPRSRAVVEAQKKRLLERKGAIPTKDDKSPTMHVRDDELWEVHRDYPRTVLEFKQLQFQRRSSPRLAAKGLLPDIRETADLVRSLLEFYAVKVYRPDMRPVILDPSDHLVDVKQNLETCLEELATTWGLNYFRIGGLSLPGRDQSFAGP